MHRPELSRIRQRLEVQMVRPVATVTVAARSREELLRRNGIFEDFFKRCLSARRSLPRDVPEIPGGRTATGFR